MGRASNIIQKIRSLLKREPAHFEVLDLNDVIRDVLPLIRADSLLPELAIRTKYSQNPLKVRADRIQIQQVIINLIINGAAAMKNETSDRRKLVIETEIQEGRSVRVSVADLGIGLEKDVMDHVFEPFFTTKPEGLGMGLAICRTIVKTHGGVMEASNNPEGGAVFSFTLPAYEENTLMTEEKPFVYVVDDDPSVRKALERLLRSAGYDAKTFASALEFMDFSHPDVPGCLILDIKMPKVGGLELQDRLVEKGISIPIIFITGHGRVPDSVRAMKNGAMDFLQKPFKERELLSVVSHAIKKDCLTRQEKKQMKTLSSRLDTLTPREHEVFSLVVRGMLNKQVAYDLGITEKTVKVHRAQVMQKMAAESLADLVRFAEKLNLHSSTV